MENALDGCTNILGDGGVIVVLVFMLLLFMLVLFIIGDDGAADSDVETDTGASSGPAKAALNESVLKLE